MDYELAKELKDAGFPQKSSREIVVGISPNRNVIKTILPFVFDEEDACYVPTLEELIESLGTAFQGIIHHTDPKYVALGLEWGAKAGGILRPGKSLIEAVGHLYIALHKKDP